MTLADRILVMHDKRIVADIANSHAYESVSRDIMTAIHAQQSD